MAHPNLTIHLQAFLAGDGGAAIDAELVLCAVLSDATPAGLAAFAGQGKPNEALLEALLGNTVLMRDMLLAGGASGGNYGQVTLEMRHPERMLSSSRHILSCQAAPPACVGCTAPTQN